MGSRPHLGNLRRGPKDTWLPGREHEAAIHAMAVLLINTLGLQQDEARALAFSLWRESQKARYR